MSDELTDSELIKAVKSPEETVAELLSEPAQTKHKRRGGLSTRERMLLRRKLNAKKSKAYEIEMNIAPLAERPVYSTMVMVTAKTHRILTNFCIKHGFTKSAWLDARILETVDLWENR